MTAKRLYWGRLPFGDRDRVLYDAPLDSIRNRIARIAVHGVKGERRVYEAMVIPLLGRGEPGSAQFRSARKACEWVEVMVCKRSIALFNLDAVEFVQSD